MNIKTSTRKTKASPIRAARKGDGEKVRARMQPTATAVKAHKSAATNRIKSARPAVVSALPIPQPVAHDSKQSRLITMLRGLSGVSMDQMMALTGWQAHTVRGTISGVLRKKHGLKVLCEESTVPGGRRYRILESGGA